MFFVAHAVTGSKDEGVQFMTQPASCGNLCVTVTATGNLEPTNQVDVGSELSGTIKTVEVDYNHHVKKGQVLARLDTSKLQAQVLQSKGSLEAAQARVLQARATVKEARSNLARLRHLRELSNARAVSGNDMDSAEADLARAVANEASSRAEVSQTRATLEANETDLSKALVRSPINGIVLTRSVEPGQTVAAAMQTPVLFTLAEDLTQMKLLVDVDEADVGKVQEGQEATFTVDAYSDRRFPALITQVRYGAKTKNSVVTYKAVLNVDNSDLSLRPGMTATAEITVKRMDNALLVPNAALRFTPPKQAKKDDPKGEDGIMGKLLPHPPPPPAKKSESQIRAGPRVWILADDTPVAVPVETEATDGTLTAIKDGSIKPETPIIVDALKVKR
jgi:HlyD family secretion protein